MNPIRTDPDNVPVFTTRDVDDYGLPDLYGYEVYRVIESRDLNLVSDYKMEQQRDFQPIHRYSRMARFRTTLLNLLGERGNIPSHVLDICECYLRPQSKNLWNDTRAILKHYGMRKWYDNIPMIIKRLGYGSCFGQITATEIDGMMREYMAMASMFDRTKQKYGRSYFPNIRFMVLKLLDQNGHRPKYSVPFVRTGRKTKALNALWDCLMLDIAVY